MLDSVALEAKLGISDLSLPYLLPESAIFINTDISAVTARFRLSIKGEGKRSSNLVGHGLLGCLPVVSIVGQGDDEERSPEDQVGHRDHYEHLHLDIFNREITFFFPS